MKVSTATEVLLVYDGECPLCEGLTRIYVRLGWVSAERRRALQDVEPELLQRFLEAGIRNEMVVYEPATGAILTGIDGIFRLWRETWMRPIARLLDRPLLRQASDIAYRFIGYNRRFLSLPKPRAQRCACEPDEHAGYNVALIVLALALPGIFVWAFSRGMGALELAVRSILLALLLAGTLAVSKEKRLRTLGHAAIGLFYASLLTAAALALASSVPGHYAWAVVVVSPIGAFYLLLRIYTTRFQYLGLGHPWLRASVAAIVAAAALSPVSPLMATLATILLVTAAQ